MTSPNGSTSTPQTPAAILAGLAVGTLCSLTLVDSPMTSYEARLIAQVDADFADDGRGVARFMLVRDEGTDDEKPITLYHDTTSSPAGAWRFESVIHEIEGEDAPAATEEPKALALNLPRGAGWLMAEAKVLDTEAEKYGEHVGYGSPSYNIVNALKGAASSLRAAVGFALLIESTADSDDPRNSGPF